MSVLDTLEICFTANLSGVDAQLSVLKGRLSGLSGSGRIYGRALSDGFAAGVRSGSGAVDKAVSAMVNSATRRIRSLLSIHSPSKVTESFGAYFGEGFARGVSGSVSAAERAAGMLGAAAMARLSGAALPESGMAAGGVEKAVQAAVERALGDVQLTIPLNVDGIKLGEASIRGINAVTRSAGRLLLNI